MPRVWPALCGPPPVDGGADEETRPTPSGPVLCSSRAFQGRMMEKDVLVDVRNAYKTNIGAFPAAGSQARGLRGLSTMAAERRDAKRF